MLKEHQIHAKNIVLFTLDVNNWVLLGMIKAQQLTCVEVYSAKAAIDNMGLAASH